PRPAPRQTSRKRIEFERSGTRAASSSKTARRGHGGSGSNGSMSMPYLDMKQAPDIRMPLPGPKAKAIIERDARFVSPSYTRDYPFVIAGGEGAVVEDVDGNLFLDCAAGIAVNSTGVSHPDVVKAIGEQAAQFTPMSGTDFYYEAGVQFADGHDSTMPVH